MRSPYWLFIVLILSIIPFTLIGVAPALKLAGEPLELYVNGKLVARGEAVVINEKFGVRLTDIVTPSERMRRLSRGG